MKFELHEEEHSLTGVYKITNLVNGEYYIGMTMNCFLNRYLQHIKALGRYNHINSLLNGSVNTFGLDKFQFSILDVCDNPKWVRQIEIYEIERGATYNIADNPHYIEKEYPKNVDMFQYNFDVMNDSVGNKRSIYFECEEKKYRSKIPRDTWTIDESVEAISYFDKKIVDKAVKQKNMNIWEHDFYENIRGKLELTDKQKEIYTRITNKLKNHYGGKSAVRC